MKGLSKGRYDETFAGEDVNFTADIIFKFSLILETIYKVRKKAFFQEYHLSVKQFGPRSGPTFYRA